MEILNDEINRIKAILEGTTKDLKLTSDANAEYSNQIDDLKNQLAELQLRLKSRNSDIDDLTHQVTFWPTFLGYVYDLMK